MQKNLQQQPGDKSAPSFMSGLFSRHGITLIVFIGIASYFLWTEHRAHVVAFSAWLPWLLILLCPLMHLFMHHGHGHDSDKKD